MSALTSAINLVMPTNKEIRGKERRGTLLVVTITRVPNKSQAGTDAGRWWPLGHRDEAKSFTAAESTRMTVRVGMETSSHEVAHFAQPPSVCIRCANRRTVPFGSPQAGVGVLVFR